MIPKNGQPSCLRSVSAIRAQKGAGLPLAIFLITVLALITVTITQLQQSTGEMEALDIQSSRAYYAAQSGIQRAQTVVVNNVDDQCSSPPSPDTPDIDEVKLKSAIEDTTSVGLAGSLAECSVDDVDVVNVVSIGSCPTPVSVTLEMESTGICRSGQDSAERTIEETVTVDVPSP